VTDPPGRASGAEPTAQPGLVARLLGSLATAVIDLGLPAIRAWLRDRLGPDADVAEVTADGAVNEQGALVHLDRVRVPIGPRGLLLLERATATVTALGSDGLPSIRLHSFTGELAFGSTSDRERGSPSPPRPSAPPAARSEPPPRPGARPRSQSPGSSYFRARISFQASPDPDETAWVWGDLTIHEVAWSGSDNCYAGSRPAFGGTSGPMNGSARLFVSSREWRLDAGSLEGALVRARFTGFGVFDDKRPTAALVPRALSVATLSLQDARVGPFLDAMAGLVGRELAVPPAIPRDAQLDGDLAWSIDDGAHADLRIGAEAIRATVRGKVDPTGQGLDGRIDAEVNPARLAFPRRLLPRDEDVVTIALDARGELRRPAVTGTLRSPELGFRLGRARFVPPVVLKTLEGEVFVKDDRAVLHAELGGAITADLDVDVRDPRSARATLRADHLSTALLRDLVRTLGVALVVPDDWAAAADLMLVPGAGMTGSISVGGPTSRITAELTPSARRVSGTISVLDIMKIRPIQGTVVPTDGLITIDLAQRGAALHGTIASPRVDLKLRGVPLIVEEPTGKLTIDRSAVTYEDLQFRGHGARFTAHGEVPFEPRPKAENQVPYLTLDLQEGGAELVTALAPLGLPPAVQVPADVVAHGRLTLDPALSIDLHVATPRGTALRLQRSTIKGVVAASDVAAGAVDGLLAIDLLLEGRVVLAVIRADRLAVRASGISLDVSEVSALLRIDREAIAWNPVRFTIAGGSLESAGIRAGEATRARVTLSQVRVHELPQLGEHEPKRYLAGRLSGAVVGSHEGSLRVAGEVHVEDATIPALDLVRPQLARYGLRPPNEDTTAPITAKVVGTDWGLTLRDVRVDLHGATVRGEIGVSLERALDGHAEVTLEEEYLRTSKLLTLPRVLADRLVIPVRVEGSLSTPRIHASLSSSLGRFLKENRLSALFSDPPPSAPRLLEPDLRETELTASLDSALAKYAPDWSRLRGFSQI
jgi:hypothetical protein